MNKSASEQVLRHALVTCLATLAIFLSVQFGLDVPTTLLVAALLSAMVGGAVAMAQKRSEGRSSSQVGTGTKKALKADQTGSQSVSGHSQGDVTPEVAALMEEFE